MSPSADSLWRDLESRLSAELGERPPADVLARWVQARFGRIEQLSAWESEFEAEFQAAADEDFRHRAILRLTERLGASPRQLRGDAKSLRRFFDRDAVTERVRRRAGNEERAVVFGLDRLGAAGPDPLTDDVVRDVIATAWGYSRDPRIREAGFRCLRTAQEHGGSGLREDYVLECQRALLRRGETTWTQNEALTILAIGAPDSAAEILRRRLSEPQPGDDGFVRRHALALLASRGELAAVRDDLIPLALADPSAAVRQKVAQVVWSCGHTTRADLARRLTADPDAKVRAQLLLGVETVPELGQELLELALSREDDQFVLRAALHVAGQWAFRVDRTQAQRLRRVLHPPIERLRLEHPSAQVRAWASAAGERLWCATDAQARPFVEKIASVAALVHEGGTVRVSGLTKAVSAHRNRVGRALAVLARDDFGFEVLPGDRLRRGDRFAFRTWRAVHEWRNPGSDKRQAHPHWIGRIFRGSFLVPSGILAELAPTKVPGEPLFQPDEGNWRPWLPLLDMVLSAIDTGGTVSIATSEGMTEIRSPESFWERVRARVMVSWRFAELAELRNWTEASGRPADSYVAALREIGVVVSFRPHAGEKAKGTPARFFSVGPAALAGIPLLQEALRYFDSIYANTVGQLWLFLLLAIGWFVLNHHRRNRSMRQARRTFNLVVGGWGTRGKSGTERLKAAVFSALGHPLISKTTGNEAMFLHAAAFGEVREMFLFRPYDKATIWEQLDLAVLASRLGAKVFLWECMGLTPAYVRVLQRHWMRDNIGTITNTYPDHEDVQGPAGRNIPEVMTNFIPEDALLITSEEQMRPILEEAARDLDTSVYTVGWLEAGLIPQEFLARFPYEEHPYNIALVTRMAQQLGVEPDVAVKEMADRVVQDIGALKVYPEAIVRTRRLEFVLGNSANERFGALGNWTRLGFDRHDPVEEPDLWITTVVNNRADRVPRSRVFASILVKDISADRHVLIGSNLEGMEGFIREAWAELAPSLTLAPPDQPEVDPLAQLEQYARRFRVVHRQDQLASIEEVLRASGRPDDDGSAEHLERCKRQLSEYEALASELRSGGSTAQQDARLREQLWSWFKDKIVVVQNYHASGEEIVRQLADMTPPGFRNRIMGMQNIKGTGLDFVYRWHAWEAVARACADIESSDEGRRKRGLQALSRFREYGILSAERVEDLVRQLRAEGTLLGEIERNQVSLIEAQLHDQLARFGRSMAAGEASGGSRWINRLEAVLDGGDAVRRRKKADRIYRDLTNERISSERAAAELKKLTTRQKGGWLPQWVASGRTA
ncbi:hypothetical protein [Parafrankia sp. BMG5.11]|uniref:hypothetical protein n=1 Tax=Parafrankia sp. BMG5.11 TaxID=222540 RepID=UPI00103E5AB1|nr:hypothetical protein [Parafrankia sp. BMG5.11]